MQHAGREDFRLELYSRRWLIGQGEPQLMEQKPLFRGGLGVARHDQASAVGGGKRDVQHMNGSKRFQHRASGESGSQGL